MVPRVNTLQVFTKTAAVTGIALFWVNFTVESLKMAWHIISYSLDDGAVFKAVCEACR